MMIDKALRDLNYIEQEYNVPEELTMNLKIILNKAKNMR